MKNYISNEVATTTTGQRIATSSAYIRRELELAINAGREGQNNESMKYEAFRHLGAALHTLEGISNDRVPDLSSMMWEHSFPTRFLEGLSSTSDIESSPHLLNCLRTHIPLTDVQCNRLLGSLELCRALSTFAWKAKP